MITLYQPASLDAFCRVVKRKAEAINKRHYVIWWRKTEQSKCEHLTCKATFVIDDMVCITVLFQQAELGNLKAWAEEHSFVLEEGGVAFISDNDRFKLEI